MWGVGRLWGVGRCQYYIEKASNEHFYSVGNNIDASIHPKTLHKTLGTTFAYKNTQRICVVPFEPRSDRNFCKK